MSFTVYFWGVHTKALVFCVFSLRAPFDEFIKNINYSLIHKNENKLLRLLAPRVALSGAGDNAEAWKVFTVNKLMEINRQ